MSILLLTFIMTALPDPLTVPVSAQRQEDRPIFSFGVIADIQYCDCEAEGTRFYRNSLLKLDEALQVFASEGIELVLDLGDNIDRDASSFNAVNSMFEGYSFTILNSPGNHDYSTDRKVMKKVVFPGGGKGYESVVYNGFRFISLNGNEVSIYGPGTARQRKEAGDLIEAMRNSGSKNAMEWNGGISDEQIAWLISQLDSASHAGEKVFIACHFPVAPYSEYVLLNHDEVLSLLGSYDNIIAWFSGHDHKGSYGNVSLIHCVTFRGMVETADENSYAIIDVYKNKIWIRGFGREKSRVLAY